MRRKENSEKFKTEKCRRKESETAKREANKKEEAQQKVERNSFAQKKCFAAFYSHIQAQIVQAVIGKRRRKGKKKSHFETINIFCSSLSS